MITIDLTEPVYPIQQVSSAIRINKPEGTCMKEENNILQRSEQHSAQCTASAVYVYMYVVLVWSDTTDFVCNKYVCKNW